MLKIASTCEFSKTFRAKSANEKQKESADFLVTPQWVSKAVLCKYVHYLFGLGNPMISTKLTFISLVTLNV